MIAKPVLEPPRFVSPSTYTTGSSAELITLIALLVAVFAIITFTLSLGTMVSASLISPVVESAEEMMVFEPSVEPISYVSVFSAFAVILFTRNEPLGVNVINTDPSSYTAAASSLFAVKPTTVTLPLNVSGCPSSPVCPLIATS